MSKIQIATCAWYSCTTCPVCNGTCRRPVPEESRKYVKSFSGYDPETDTLPCGNCGGQYQSGRPTGMVRINKSGEPCEHSYEHKIIGRCWHEYTCKHCNDIYQIDSSD